MQVSKNHRKINGAKFLASEKTNGENNCFVRVGMIDVPVCFTKEELSLFAQISECAFDVFKANKSEQKILTSMHIKCERALQNLEKKL
jgi:hypothetical protein